MSIDDEWVGTVLGNGDVDEVKECFQTLPKKDLKIVVDYLIEEEVI